VPELVTVSVKLVSLLKDYAPGRGATEFEVGLPDGSAVEDLIRKLGIPPEMVGPAMVNGKKLEAPLVLAGGDQVLLWPPMVAGGF
jgi:hypothetical protein